MIMDMDIGGCDDGFLEGKGVACLPVEGINKSRKKWRGIWINPAASTQSDAPQE